MEITLRQLAELTPQESQAIQALGAAVYPPEVVLTLPGRHYHWAPREYSILVWDANLLISHVGVLTRQGTLDGREFKIGGVGYVMTHPQYQGKGFAGAGLRRAVQFLTDNIGVDFSVLVCRSHLIPLYSRLGWKVFTGPFYVEQPGGRLLFNMAGPMTHDGQQAAPTEGILDLNGMPW